MLQWAGLYAEPACGEPLMKDREMDRRDFHRLTTAALSGIAAGLGAKMPDLREESPSKIAAGFGGTLSLVVSAIYIIVIVLLTALPTHFYLAVRPAEAATLWVKTWLIAGLLAASASGAIATLVPMYVGLRAFRSLEF